MLKFTEDLSIEHLPLDVYKDLVAELNRDDSWRTLAIYVSEKLDYSHAWVNGLEDNNGSTNDTPASKLLVELNIRLCTVGILSMLLEDCNLLKILAILHTPDPVRIITHPDEETLPSADLCVSLRNKVRLICRAYGLPPPNYQWYHEDVRLEGETSEELNILMTSISQQGSYRCKVYQINLKGEKLSEIFSRPLHVSLKPTSVIIEKQPQVYLEIKEGDNLVLCCEATSHPSPQYQWYRNNDRLDYQTSSILMIEKFTAKDEGKYYCHIFNGISEKYTQHSTVLMELPRQKAVAKVALLIANEKYDNQEILRTPKNDVAKVAKILDGLGFTTICLTNLTLLQMKNAIKIFSDSLVEGTYGLFYFAGHGFKMQENYMLSIDSPTNYLRKDAICESELLSVALKNDPALLVVILDMCQTIPPIEFNPEIHGEIPSINTYKGQKNLRNLLQAYSTSCYRPSYERMGKDYGLYATHLCKYLDENIPVTKVFEQVGKSIDTWFKGAERKQIPMFATTVTKPYKLTDSIVQSTLPHSIVQLEKLIKFSNKVIDINFQQTGVKCKAKILQYAKPYLNCIQISVIDLDDKWEVNFFNSVHTKRNNLFKCASKNKCWFQSPETNEGPLVISLLDNGVPVGATLLEINELVPTFLYRLNQVNT